MRCPVCKEDMIVIEHSGIELDHCLQCRGVWFDRSELELLLQSLEVLPGDAVDTAEAGSSRQTIREKPRRCPLCRKKMGKMLMGTDKTIVIDRCNNGDGLWFDGGEVTQLIEQLAPEAVKSSEKVLSFVYETLKG